MPISTGKPGFARCVNGGWVEHDLGAAAPPRTPSSQASSAMLDGESLNRLVTIDVKDADLPRVLDLLGDVTAMKFDLLPGVSVKVTMAVKDMPAREALELIETTAGLTYHQEGQTVYVSARGAGQN